MDVCGSLCPHGHCQAQEGLSGKGHSFGAQWLWVSSCGNLSCLISLNLSFLIWEKGIQRHCRSMVSEGTFTKCMVLFEVQTQSLVIKTLEQPQPRSLHGEMTSELGPEGWAGCQLWGVGSGPRGQHEAG